MAKRNKTKPSEKSKTGKKKSLANGKIKKMGGGVGLTPPGSVTSQQQTW